MIVIIAAERGGVLDHCAPFPQDLVARLVLLYSHRGETVLDPFMGSGQTMIVAKAYGRNFVGVDMEQNYVDYARSRINKPVSIRSRQLLAKFVHLSNDSFLSHNGH